MKRIITATACILAIGAYAPAFAQSAGNTSASVGTSGTSSTGITSGNANGMNSTSNTANGGTNATGSMGSASTGTMGTGTPGSTPMMAAPPSGMGNGANSSPGKPTAGTPTGGGS